MKDQPAPNWRGTLSRRQDAREVPESAPGCGGFPLLTDGALMRDLLEAAPEAMVVAGEDGRIRLVNAQVEALFGYARKLAEAALARQMAELTTEAITDPLTGLVNRREFERLLGAPRSDGFAVLVIDVDHLKVVNDAYGHEAGDAHLRAIATALRLSLRDQDTVARVGGDEFAALLPGRTMDEASAVAERLRRAMYGVVVPHGLARVSIGCARGDSGDDGVRVRGAADEALYRAKANGRDRVETAATGAVPLRGRSLARWERSIPELISSRAIVAVYQPIVRLFDGSVLGYEALCRCEEGDPEAGVESLFAAAERLGMHRDLDWISRRTAVGDAHRLPANTTVFVNVGVSALLDPLHGVDQMLLLLRWGGLAPRQVVLEIADREAIRDLGRFREVLADYRRHGFRFALDHVGEGHSTFATLAAAMPEFVKVSRTLTAHAQEDGPAAVIRALVAFTQATETHLVAEGLETPAAVTRVIELGVSHGQGYSLGRPAPPERWSPGHRDPRPHLAFRRPTPPDPRGLAASSGLTVRR